MPCPANVTRTINVRNGKEILDHLVHHPVNTESFSIVHLQYFVQSSFNSSKLQGFLYIP